MGTITADYVNLTIPGATDNVQLTPGDTKQFDLDGDGNNDIEITLTSITDGKANFVFKAVLGASTTKKPTQPVASTTTAPSKSWVVWLMVSLVLLILGIWFFIILFRRRRKQSKPAQW